MFVMFVMSVMSVMSFVSVMIQVVSIIVEVSSSSLFLIKACLRGETFPSKCLRSRPVSGQLVSASMSAAQTYQPAKN